MTETDTDTDTDAVEELLLTTPARVQFCVRYLRHCHRWHQADLADTVGRSQQWLSNLESDQRSRRRGPAIGDVLSVLSTLGVTVVVRPSDTEVERHDA